MSALVTISLLGWTPVVLLLFLLLKPRRAVIVSFIAAWLFLPVKVPDLLVIKGLPELDKMTVTGLAVLLGAALFDQGRLLSFRPRRYDIPMLLWCIVPLFSSLTNTDSTVFGHPGIRYPLYDGLSEVLKQTVTWGLPYLIGRVYFNNLDALRELAIGVFVGGLIYVPLCLFEFKMSPQLHYLVYGSHPHVDFRQAIRGDGYRPTVFMAHGLMVALWMATATLLGAWMWFSGSLRKILGVHVMLFVVPLLGVTVWCKSLASLMLMCMGLATLYFITRTRMRWPIILLIMLAPTYMTLRGTQVWDGMNAVQFIEDTISEDRAQSLGLRFSNENQLADRALEKPVFGWGGWGRSRVYDRFGKDISITDGMWVIALSQNGLVGLASLTAVILLPVWLTLKRIPVRLWSHPKAAPAAAMAVVLILYMVDNLLNAMINPVFMLIAGALSAQVALKTRSRVRRGTQHTSPDTTPEPPEETPDAAATDAA
jgi:hypothetical protein